MVEAAQKDMGFQCRLVGSVAAVLALMGCASTAPSPATDPRGLLRQYAAALRARDAARAWELLDEDARGNANFDAFRRWLESHPADATKLAEMLERPIDPVSVTARIADDEEGPLELVEVDGRFRILRSSLDSYSQSSPRRALLSFVRAVKNRRYDVLLKLVPAAERKQLNEATLARAFEGEDRSRMAALARNIELSLPRSRLEVRGNRASFDLGAGSRLTLRLDEGAWTVEDFLP